MVASGKMKNQSTYPALFACLRCLIISYLGKGAKIMKSKPGHCVYQSADGKKQVRIDIDPHGDTKGPHIHVEGDVGPKGKRLDVGPHRIYPQGGQ